MSTPTRRDLLKLTAAAATTLAASHLTLAQDQQQQGGPTPPTTLPTPESTKRGDMLYRPLGTTGHTTSLLALGGHHVGTLPSSDDCTRLLRSAIDRGVNFLDNSCDYHNGKSELWMGQALKDGYRDKVFLMTKINGRSKPQAAKEIDECLQRLSVDHIDLLQHHAVTTPEEPDQIFSENGAQQALLDARKAGKIRFIGFTGHRDPAVHLKMLALAKQHDFHFSTVQMPLNLLDAHYKSFQHQVLPELVKQNIAPLAMKTFATGTLAKLNLVPPVQCLQYVMNLPISTLIAGVDSPQTLDQAFEAVRTFHPLSQTEVASLLEKTRPAAANGQHEPFKHASLPNGTPYFTGYHA